VVVGIAASLLHTGDGLAGPGFLHVLLQPICYGTVDCNMTL
jgi:hypothetical protein